MTVKTGAQTDWTASAMHAHRHAELPGVENKMVLSSVGGDK